ncbi:MAG: replication initiator protein A [Rhodospirillales bacterium]|jgi:plasmid replication initiation protein|nr:replication initiator protein A [Rhodospirillales bacterium]
MPQGPPSERKQLELFSCTPEPSGIRDYQDLMAFPFFSLAKGRRVKPLIYDRNDVAIKVEAVPEYGMATIWDADLLIWAASQIMDARNRGAPTSRLLRFMPHQFLRFANRPTGKLGYERLRAALDRLQSTTIQTNIRSVDPDTTPARKARRLHRFSWINEWSELTIAGGYTRGMEIVLPDWFYQGVINENWVLAIDPAYFDLTGGIERWLYRLARKHGGRSKNGWGFSFKVLYEKSGSLARFSDFAFDLRRLAHKQSLPGYQLSLSMDAKGNECLQIMWIA